MKKYILFFTVCLGILHSAIAQKKDDGKIYVKILKNINGTQTVIDTVFNAEDKAAAEEFMRTHNIGVPEDKDYDFKISAPIGEQDRRVIEESIIETDKAIDNVNKEITRALEQIHINIETDDDAIQYEFNFNDLNLEEIGRELDKCLEMKMDTSGEGINLSIDMKGIDADTQKEIEESMARVKEDMKRVAKDMEDRKVNITIKIDNDTKRKTDTTNNVRKRIKNMRDENGLLSKVKVYPNPAKNNVDVTFDVKELSNLRVELCDANGNVLNSETFSNFQGKYQCNFNLRNRARGVYFVKIYCGDDERVLKFVAE